MKDQKKKGTRTNTFTMANPLIIDEDCVESGGQGHLTAKIIVERATNEEFGGSCSHGLQVWINGAQLTNPPVEAAGSPVLTAGGTWKHTFEISQMVDCANTYTITAEVDYIIRPNPKQATPVDVTCPECGSSGGSGSSGNGLRRKSAKRR